MTVLLCAVTIGWLVLGMPERMAWILLGLWLGHLGYKVYRLYRLLTG